MKNKNDGRCPNCNSTNVKKTREKYCGPGDINYIFCECRRCGEKWEEKD
jgi:hypothetical protein